MDMGQLKMDNGKSKTLKSEASLGLKVACPSERSSSGRTRPKSSEDGNVEKILNSNNASTTKQINNSTEAVRKQSPVLIKLQSIALHYRFHIFNYNLNTTP